MDTIVINVASAVERMSFMAQQLDALGLQFERLEATTPKTLKRADETHYWDSWERPLKDTEKACLSSHIDAWEIVASAEKPRLILEDDVLLSKTLPSLLNSCLTLNEIDHLTLEVRNRKKIVSKRATHVTDHHQILRLYQDRSGAAAYILWPSGAKKLLRRAQKQSALADAMICKAYELRSFQAEPCCALQLDKTEIYGVPTQMNTQSQIDAGTPSQQRTTIKFRLRRISAQIRMGLRALRYAAVAERRFISLSPIDFSR